MVDAPEGYKPVIHRKCGKVYSWVKESVTPNDRMRAEDAMYLDGSIPEPHQPIQPCPSCGQVLIHSRELSLT